MPAQRVHGGRWCAPPRWLLRAPCAVAAVAAVAALAATGAAQARSRALDETAQQYRAGHPADAFGRLSALANRGDADAALMARRSSLHNPPQPARGATWIR
jgi:hypothetical protein